MQREVVLTGNMSEVIRLYDDLYFRKANLEIRDQCNSGFVVLNHSVAIIDYPGQNPDHEIIDEAEKVTGLPVKYIILTHAHCDHVTGFRMLHRDDISLIARRTAIEQLYLEGYPVPAIHTAVEKSMSLTLDGRTLQLEVPDQTAHSPWDMLVGIADRGVIFGGDMIALHKNMFFHSSNIDGWIAALSRLMKTDWKYIARGHGDIIEMAQLAQTVEYLKLLRCARLWQMEYNENLTIQAAENPKAHLSEGLSLIVEKLREEVDAYNVARQINQLYYKLR